MEPFRRHVGHMAPLPRADVDTDQIIPKQFLKRIERTGFGEFLFSDWRRLADGTPDPDFPLNRPEYQGASVLVTGPNFGCGSSREHAPWALQQAGFAVVIAPSFADIFRSNCAKTGLLTVTLPAADVDDLLEVAGVHPDTLVEVDLEAQTVAAPGVAATFEIEPAVKMRLLGGLDDIGLTLQQADAIAAFEVRRPSFLPTTTGARM
jgi:3-isopropylmalate/(R)-2-methylmalate dehydratase small subunit